MISDLFYSSIYFPSYHNQVINAVTPAINLCYLEKLRKQDTSLS